MRLATSVIAARLPVAMTATTRRVAAPCPPTAMTGMFFPSSRAQAIPSIHPRPGQHLTLPSHSAPTKHNNNDNKDDDGAINPGSNLFVTGIHPRLEEAEVTRLFEKYGEVEKCQIMKDPHTGESRGFGFVKMVTSDMADAAKDGLQGEVIEGRTLSIEKARRARPRTPTPGKYFGPPKRGKSHDVSHLSF